LLEKFADTYIDPVEYATEIAACHNHGDPAFIEGCYSSLNWHRDSRKLLLVAVLVLATISPLVQTVGATFFFDPLVMLHWKADPSLRSFLAEHSTKSQAQVRVVVVFSYVPSSGQIQQLLRLGTLETFTGHVATMHLPLNLLPRIASLDFVQHVSYPRALARQLDTSVPEILADQVWNTVKDTGSNSVNGTGVVIGIVDTGIDYHHRDFFFPNGTSKILYIWDQSTTGNAPLGFDYGNECSRADIESGTCSEIDGSTNGFDPGHGTAVAAVAASSGEAATFFASCLRYDGATWHDDTQLCQASGTSSPLLESPSDYRYFGNLNEFNQVFFDIKSPGSYRNFIWEYSHGSQKWAPLQVESNQTSDLARNGTVFFTPPADWAPDSVDGRTGQYWVRMRTDGVRDTATVEHIQAGPPYRGVAPGALIIAVKLRDGSDASILDGTNFIARKARELGLPYVINDSLADSLGAHDGSDSLELAFTDLADTGVPIVIVAGNSRSANRHVSGKLSPGQSVSVPWVNDPANNPNYVDLWYSVSDNLAISVRTPNGFSVQGPTPESGVNTPDGNIIILPDERPTGREWSVNLTTTNPLRWSFTLTAITVSNGKWDAWTESNAGGGPTQFIQKTEGVLAGLYEIDPTDTIDSPGNAKGVITVGDYVTKYFWRSGCDSCIDYTTSIGKRGIWWVTTSAVGNISLLSGMGPTRDGRIKPDIVAPGENIAAARASNAPEKYSDPDNYHQVWRGTSFSAAHVTGVIALMLQMNHYLSPNEIKSILTETGREDQFTGPIDKQTGSPLWGWGKVNALNSTLDAMGLYAVRVEIDSVGLPLVTNLTRDGEKVARITLNQTRTVVLEFQRGGNHTVSLSPYLTAQPGTRYALEELPWTFSSGGVRRFHYKLQFYLQVTSEYGYATGTGWYDANSTAVANVIPQVTQGHEFQGWIGAASSSSEAVEVKMDSSKVLIATWRPTSGQNMASILGVAMAIAISVVIALLVRYRYLRRTSR